MFFKKKTSLDEQLALIKMNLENNYKDEARKALNNSIELLKTMQESGELKGKALEKKKEEVEAYVKKMEGYGHNIPVGW